MLLFFVVLKNYLICSKQYISVFQTSIFKIFKYFNRQNTALVIFLLILANYIGYGLIGGEEQYFALAKQYMQKDWMPHSFCLNDPAGYKLIFQVIFGFLLKFLSFEQLAFISRFINFIFYAIPLSLIFKKLKFTNIEIIVILQVGLFMHQSIWAGEWFFKNFEQKSLAYIFVFYAIYNLLIDKAYKSIIYAAIATYIHFLVGGWMALFLIIYSLVRSRKISEFIKHGALYFVLTLPFILFLASQYIFNSEPSVIEGVNINRVYSVFRLKHHIGMFSDLRYFVNYHLGGVLITIGLFLLCVFYFRKFKSPDILKLNTLNIIIFIQQFVFIGIALIDKNGVLLKTYPFRTSSLSAFLILLEIAVIIKRFGLFSLFSYYRKKFPNIPYTQSRMHFALVMHLTLFLIFIPRFSIEISDTIKNFYIGEDKLTEDMKDLILFSKNNTDPESVFLFLDSDKPFSFVRRAERDRFVINKFTPTNNQIIFEWYQRQLIKSKIAEDISNISLLQDKYKVNYLVSEKSLLHKQLTLLKQFGTYYLYCIEQ